MFGGPVIAANFRVSFPEKKQSKRFVIGIGLIVAFSLFCGYINIGLFFLFGLPLIPVLIGLILVWISPQSWQKRLYATLLIVPCFIFGFALLYWTLPRAVPETFLIPKDFRGTFAIIFVQGCSAEPIRYEGGRRIYRIPESGVLFQNGVRTYGVMDQRFYVLDESGNPTELPVFYYSNYEEEMSSWRWKFSNTELREDTLGVFWAYVRYEAFTVSTFKESGEKTSEKREVDIVTLNELIDSESKKRNCEVN